jgi:hypothetical protein
MIEACIPQTTGSKIGQYTGYSEGGFNAFPPSLQAYARIQILLGHDHFLSDNFRINNTFLHSMLYFFFLWLNSPIPVLAPSMKLSVSLQLLDLGQSVGLFGG